MGTIKETRHRQGQFRQGRDDRRRQGHGGLDPQDDNEADAAGPDRVGSDGQEGGVMKIPRNAIAASWGGCSRRSTRSSKRLLKETGWREKRILVCPTRREAWDCRTGFGSGDWGERSTAQEVGRHGWMDPKTARHRFAEAAEGRAGDCRAFRVQGYSNVGQPLPETQGKRIPRERVPSVAGPA